jgi:uncharacterized protein (DUF2267 family)
MSHGATGLEVFDTTLQKANEWRQEIRQEFGTDSRQQAYLILRATLYALRERLPLEPMAHLGAQLPMLIRGFYYEGWSPHLGIYKWHRDEFLERILVHFVRTDLESVDPETVVRAVFQVLARKMALGKIEKMIHVLPLEFRDLWPVSVSGRARSQAV